MMKKILLISLFLTMGLVACSESSPQNDATSGDEDAERSAEALQAEDAKEEAAQEEEARDDIERAEGSAEGELTHDRSGCAPAGCSGQICAEAGADIMTTCEFRPQYACYQQAVCERQPDGACGWTETDELRECLASAGSTRAVLE